MNESFLVFIGFVRFIRQIRSNEINQQREAPACLELYKKKGYPLNPIHGRVYYLLLKGKIKKRTLYRFYKYRIYPVYPVNPIKRKGSEDGSFSLSEAL